MRTLFKLPPLFLEAVSCSVLTRTPSRMGSQCLANMQLISSREVTEFHKMCWSLTERSAVVTNSMRRGTFCSLPKNRRCAGSALETERHVDDYLSALRTTAQHSWSILRIDAATSQTVELESEVAELDTSSAVALGARPPRLIQEYAQSPPMPILSAAGGGLFFFWQLGVVKYLQEHFDLSRVHFRGASAGGFIATLACCKVDLEKAVANAYKIDRELFERPLSVIGVWGGLIRNWLDEVLPENAHEMCSGRLQLVVTDVLGLRMSYAELFDSKAELIDACMASAHVPLFLDWQPFAFYRGRPYLDGGFVDFITWSNSEQLTAGGAFVIDHTHDDLITSRRFDSVKSRDYEGLGELVTQGYNYGARVVARGDMEPVFGTVRRRSQLGEARLSGAALAH